MSDLCVEYGISRKTGYKWKERYTATGREGLFDRSRKPYRSPQRTPDAVVEAVLALRRKRRTWGPRKLRDRLEALHPEVRWPAPSTIGVLLKDAGLVDGKRRRRRASPTARTARIEPTEPNELWCMDFKGQFRLGDGRYCYPLTVTDQVSRYVLGCEGLPNTKGEPAARELELVFREYGLPERIRSDNGTPFASTGLGGLSQMSVWLMRLGIGLERIEPGCPQQNGRHERMHRTLKEDATRPAAATMLQQQEKFDEFRRVFNEERPHESLGMKTPASIYEPSKRRLPKQLQPVRYPLHDESKRVGAKGRLYFKRQSFHLTSALRGQHVGLRQLQDDVWLTTFMNTDLAYLNIREKTVTAIPNNPEPKA